MTSTPGTAAAQVVRRAGIHVVDVEHVAPRAVRLTVQPGNGRPAAAALIRAGWDASTAHDETGTRVLAVEPEPDPADLDDAPAVAAYTITAQSMTPDGLARAGAHHRCRRAVTTGPEQATEAHLLAVIEAEQARRSKPEPIPADPMDRILLEHAAARVASETAAGSPETAAGWEARRRSLAALIAAEAAAQAAADA